MRISAHVCSQHIWLAYDLYISFYWYAADEFIWLGSEIFHWSLNLIVLLYFNSVRFRKCGEEKENYTHFHYACFVFVLAIKFDGYYFTNIYTYGKKCWEALNSRCATLIFDEIHIQNEAGAKMEEWLNHFIKCPNVLVIILNKTFRSKRQKKFNHLFHNWYILFQFVDETKKKLSAAINLFLVAILWCEFHYNYPLALN